MKAQIFDLPFDQFQRYKCIKDCVKVLKSGSNRGGSNPGGRNPKPLKLLDVGGYPGLIRDFLPEEDITVLDLEPLDKPYYVQGDATAMPFEDKNFDTVVSVDVFEHIPLDKRENFLEEAFRVSREYIILGAPFFSQEVELAEKIILEFITKILGQKFVKNHPLKEHIEKGLPKLDFLSQKIQDKGFSYISFPGGGLYNWLLMYLGKHFISTLPESEKLYQMVDHFYNHYLSLKDQGTPSYRTFFVISKNNQKNILERIANQFKPKKETFEESSYKLELFNLFLTLFELETKRELKGQKEHLAQLEHQLQQKEIDLTHLQNRFNSLEHQMQLKDAHIVNLEHQLQRIRSSLAYRLYKKLRRR